MWGMSLVVRRVVLTGVWGFVVCVDRFFRVVLGVWDAFVWRLGGSVSPDLLGAFGNSANMVWAAWGGSAAGGCRCGSEGDAGPERG